MYFTIPTSGEGVALTLALCQWKILSEIAVFDAKPPFFHVVTLGQNRGFLRNLFREAFLRWNLMSPLRYRDSLWKHLMARDCRKRVLRKCPNVSCTENGRFVSKLKKSNGTTEKLPWFVKNQDTVTMAKKNRNWIGSAEKCQKPGNTRKCQESVGRRNRRCLAAFRGL